MHVWEVGAIAVAVVIALVVWLVVRGGSSSSNSPVPSHAQAVPVSISGLNTLAHALPMPIYWAGAKPNVAYELTKTKDGRVWIRYLPPKAKIGERKTPYLTIGTYPVKNAFSVTSSASRQKGTTLIPLGSKAVAFYNAKHPSSVYLAYAGSDYQIEVYDPSAATARQLVSSRQIKPVAGGPSSSTGAPATRATPESLKALSAKLNQPIYWLGPEGKMTYELTQTSGGQIYVRYLPRGEKIGERQTPFLTVGTYPVANAFAATQQLAKKHGSVAVDIGGKGVAFYSKSTPTSVYLAYPGQNYQIEVFDPSAGRAAQLVSSGRGSPVR